MAHVDRSKARRLTLAAQGGALLLIGVAVAALLLLEFKPQPAPGPEQTTENTGTEAAAEPESQGQPEPATNVDILQTAKRLQLASGIPDPEELNDDPTGDIVEAEPETPEPVTPASPVRYVGAMIAGERSFALVIADNRQRVVRVGEAMPGVEDGATVTAILADAIEYETDGQTTRLDRQEAEGAMVGQISESASGGSAIRAELEAAERARIAPNSANQNNRDRDREAFRAEVERRRDAIRREQESRENNK